MLSIENRINGMLISVMNIANMEKIDSGMYRYRVDYYRFSQPEYKTSFDVTHRRDDGCEKLVLEAYKIVDKRFSRVLSRSKNKQ